MLRRWAVGSVSAIVFALTVWGSAAEGVKYYVAPTGKDANPGTIAKPFATLQKAQQQASRMAGRAAVTICLRAGTYYLPETMVFTPEDSGTRAAPVVYQAYRNERAVVSGGVRLNGLKWEPYKNGILQAQVPAGFSSDQLFVNGVRQPLARYPNFDANEPHFNGYAADALSPERAARWADPRGGFIHALHKYEWGGMHYVITGKNPDNTITYSGGWQNNRPMGMHDRYRMVENIFEELDAPGEWFLDGRTATLYYYPPAGLNLATATIEAVRLRHIVEFRGTEQTPIRFISFKGLTFRHAARTFMENKEPLVRSDWTTYRGGALFFTGTEDCAVEDCFIDQVGSNAVFVNSYNRRLMVRGCHIAKAGANGVAFIGARDAARVPRDWQDHSQTLATLDRTPGPRNANYPSDCRVDDCLIYLTGRVEKQTAAVQIELSQGIKVSHCSIYDVPRAGINIGDGCWGGHVIEYCDVFDTVRETGDHGSFNSWGRDRYWGLSGLDLNNDDQWAAYKDTALLDAVKPTILRNNRWRCDHGWDIDLDDGSSNYEIRDNLCLHGGLKNREGFYRVVENNVIVDNSFHPHVWYRYSQDVFRRNIVFTEYAPIQMPQLWGREIDYNLLHRPGTAEASPAASLQQQSGRDEHSVVQDAGFVDPRNGDYRVKAGSPALKLGFVNFPMDQFGVRKPELKAIARTPELPKEAIGPNPFGPVPSPNQLRWQELEYYGFCHFTINTFTGKELGYGDEPESAFDPTDFDADQIVRAFKEGGMKGVILTTKHHDGFCLWPSKFTRHSVRNSPWKGGKGDVVKEIADACRRNGLKFGIYYSPWDRNCADYGKPGYVTYFQNQLRELLTGYGPVFEVWFDGYNGDNGKGSDGWHGGSKDLRRIDPATYYRWPEMFRMIRRLQPEAHIHSDIGPDSRWGGNENGEAGDPCWNTVLQKNLVFPALNFTLDLHGDRFGDMWLPSEMPYSIRCPVWFWRPGEENRVRNARQLFLTYLTTVGRGASLLLNLPPDRHGCIPAEDARSAREFNELLTRTFAKNMAAGAVVTASNVRRGNPRYAAANVLSGKSNGFWATDDDVRTAELVLDFGKHVTFNLISLREYLPLGQRIDEIALDAWDGSLWTEFARASSVGNRRLLLTRDITSSRLRLRVTKASACVALSELGVYCYIPIAPPAS